MGTWANLDVDEGAGSQATVLEHRRQFAALSHEMLVFKNHLDAVLAAMESIDYITIFDELDPLELIKQVRPDILVKGADWGDKGVIGREFVESCGGRVELAPLLDGKSSTQTINKLKGLNGTTDQKDE